jgi:hypothetical protein
LLSSFFFLAASRLAAAVASLRELEVALAGGFLDLLLSLLAIVARSEGEGLRVAGGGVL